MNRPPLTAEQARARKRYGWLRLYTDFPGHKKWRLVSSRSGVRLTDVQMVVVDLFCVASKGKPRGYLGNLDFDECAVSTGVSPDDIVKVYKELTNSGWIAQDHIVGWPDRQPDHEDPTANDRKRNERAKINARRKQALGLPLSEAEALLLSRVTITANVKTEAPAERPAPIIWKFELVQAEDDSAMAQNAAMVANLTSARVWLFGNGDVEDFGSAAAVVGERLGMLRMSAAACVGRWFETIGEDHVRLAIIISGAARENLGGQAFDTIVQQRIAAFVRERDIGPPLPLPWVPIKGGKRG